MTHVSLSIVQKVNLKRVLKDILKDGTVVRTKIAFRLKAIQKKKVLKNARLSMTFFSIKKLSKSNY